MFYALLCADYFDAGTLGRYLPGMTPLAFPCSVHLELSYTVTIIRLESQVQYVDSTRAFARALLRTSTAAAVVETERTDGMGELLVFVIAVDLH